MFSTRWRQTVKRMVRRSRHGGAIRGRVPVRLELLEDRTLLANDITINAVDNNIDCNNLVAGKCIATGLAATLSAATLQAQLLAGNISVDAADTTAVDNGEPGQIVWNNGNDIDYNGVGATRDLTFQAGAGAAAFVNIGANLLDSAPNATDAVNFTIISGDLITFAVVGPNVALGAGTLTLNPAAGGVTQAAGTLTGTNLLLLGAGAFTVDGGGNNFVTLAAAINGGLTYFDADDLTIGTVLMTIGINTTNNDVLLVTSAAGSVLTVSEAVDGSAVIILADDMNISNLINGTSFVFLAPVTAGRVLDLGTDSAGNLGLTNVELNLITTSVLVLGTTTNTGNIQITSQITAPAVLSTLVLLTGGAITDNTPAEQTDITVPNLRLDAATGIGAADDLDVAVTRVAALNANGGNIQIQNTGALIIDTVLGRVGITGLVSGNAVVLASGPLLVNEPVSMPGDITLQAGNSAAAGDNLTIAANVTSTGGGTIFLLAGDDILHTNGIIQSTGGLVRFTADNEADGSGGVNQSGGSLVAGDVVFRAFGTVFYGFATTNNVTNLAANVTGPGSGFEYRDADNLIVNTVDGVAGVTTINGDITLCSVAGNLAVDAAIMAGAGTVRLQAAGNVTQMAAGTITGMALGVRAGTGIALGAAVNNVTTFAAQSAAGAIEYRDADGFALGMVTAQGCFTLGVTGVSGGDIILCTVAGNLAINAPINAGANTVRLQAGGAVTQTAGITAGALGVRAGAAITLTSPANSVGVFAAFTSGAGSSIQLLSTAAVTVDTVTALGCFTTTTVGVTSTNGDINLLASSLTINQPITAGTADVRLVASTTVTQAAAGVITADELGVGAGGAVTLCAAVNDVNTLAVSTVGLVEFRDLDDLIIGTVAAGGGFGGAAGIVSGNNDINLRTGTNLTLNQVLNAGTGDIRIVAGTTVTQAATGVVTADELGILAGGAVTLCAAATNDVNTLAISAPGLIEFRDADDLIVGAVAAGGNCGFTGAAGLFSGNGDINLRTGTSLTINQPLNAGTGDVRIVAGTTVTQAATGAGITADELGILAGGAVALGGAGNDVNTLAVNAVGIEFQDIDDLTIGTVAAGGNCGFTGATGLGGGGDLTLCVGGALTLNAPLNAGAGTVRLQAGGAVTQAATAAITAGALGVRAGGAITLTAGANDVGTFAAFSSGAGSAIQYTDATALTVDTVTASGCFMTTTVGVVSTNGNITLNVGAALTVNRNLTAGTAAILINAGLTVAADVTINNTAVISAATTTINTGAGADALIINNPAGSLFALAGAITFNAGGQAGDRLELNDGGAAGLTETYAVGPGNTEGTITFAGLSTASLAFTGVTSPILDSITVGTLTLNATAANNTVALDNSPVAGRLRLSVDAFQPMDFVNKANLVLNGQGGDDTVFLRNTAVAAGLTSVTVNGGAGNDTINVQTTRVVTTANGGDGDDTINVGSNAVTVASSTLNEIQAALTVNGDAGSNTLNLNDQGTTAASTYTLTATTFQRTGTALVTYATIQTLNLNAGSGADTINVVSTAAGTATTVNANGGDDTITSATDALAGPLTVNGGPGTDTLAVNGTAAADTFTITNNTVARTGSATITYATVERLTVNGLEGDDLFNVLSTFAVPNDIINTTIVTGPGMNTVNVGSDPVNLAASTLDGIRGQLTLDFTGGVMVLNLNDRGSTTDNQYSFSTVIGRNGTGPILLTSGPGGVIQSITLNAGSGNDRVFAEFSVIVNAGPGNDTILQQGTAGTSPAVLNGEDGDDIITLGNLVPNLDRFGAPVTVNGNAGNNMLNLNDQGTTAANTYTLSATTFQRTGTAVVTYGTIQTLNLNAGSGADTINVLGTSATNRTTVNAGAGNDTVNVGSDPNNVAASNLNGIAQLLFVNGDAGGSDTLNFNDQGTTANSIYTLGNSAFQRSGTAVVTYTTVETVNLNAGSGDDTINVLNTPAGVLTTVSPGGGANTINVGSNPVTLGNSVLDGVQGQLNINNDRGGVNTLNLNDQGSTTNNNYVLFNSLTRNGVSNIFVLTAGGQLRTLNLNVGSGNDTVLSVFSPPVLTLTMNAGNDVVNLQLTALGNTTMVSGGTGDDIINVGGAANTLDTIQGAVTVNGDAGNDTLNVNDAGNTAPTLRYEITSTSVRRTNGVRITYGTLEALNVTAGLGNDVIVVMSTHAGVTNVNGNAGNDLFSLCNAIAGPTNLNGLGGDDQFALQGGTDLRGGVIEGGDGVNRLNYSGVTPAGVFAGFTTPVTVNLSAAAFATVLQGFLPPPNGGRAINVAALSATGTGGIRNIRDVVAGSGDDIVIGDDLANQLEGRLGSDLLFGQGGNDSLLGGLGLDVLYGGDDNDLVDALSGERSPNAVDSRQNFLFGGNGDDVLFARSAQDQLFGEGGRDRLIIRNCPDFLQGQLTLDIGADGGSITILEFAIRDQNGQPATPPPMALMLAQLDCEQTLPASVPEVVVSNSAGDDMTALPARFLGAAETKANLVRGYYLRFLGRAPEETGLRAWLEAFARGAQPEDVLAGVLGSEEYLARQSSDPAAFVRSLYADLLGRAPAEAEIAGWVRVIGSTSRAVVVRAFAGSDEFRASLIQSWYGHYLGRAADRDGLQAWLARMRAGATQDQVQAALLASAEYREVAGGLFTLREGDGSAAFVRSLYSKVLGRIASEAEVAAWLQVVGS